MTVEQWYQERQGQSLLVPGADPSDSGQCVQAADYALNEIYGLPYVWLNAIDWWRQFGSTPQLANNFVQVTDGSVKKGDFVIFNQNVGSVYGHIDIAIQDGTIDQFTGADSNWGGNKTLHLVNHIGRQYVLGSLRLKGATMEPANEGDLENIFEAVYCLPVTQADKDYWLPKNFSFKDLFYAVKDSARYATEHFINDGDIVNMKAKGIDISGAKGKMWKAALYDPSTKGISGISRAAVLDYINNNLK